METRIVVTEYYSRKVAYICEKREPKRWYKYLPTWTKNLGWDFITFKWGYGVNEYDRNAIFETEDQAKLCIEEFVKKEEATKTWLSNQRIKRITIKK